ncbi:MAG: hypothetical protein ACTSUK_06895 [Promethearchaeota archaeon]
MKSKKFEKYDVGIILMILGLVVLAIYAGWGIFTGVALICAGTIFMND